MYIALYLNKCIAQTQSAKVWISQTWICQHFENKYWPDQITMCALVISRRNYKIYLFQFTNGIMFNTTNPILLPGYLLCDPT